MSKLIDLILGKDNTFVQKRRIKKGFEMQLKRVDSRKDNAESWIEESRSKLVKADSAEKVADILNDMCKYLQEIVDCENTKMLLEKEKIDLFETEVK